MHTSDYLIIFMKVLGALALLIYGMKVMSEALQKMAGSQLRHILGAMTTNRFTGMLTGMFVTCAVQSSSATTVMTVSFVNAGLLTLAQAISVIMGANIGTTLTAWIMSLGFNVDLTMVVFPAFFIGIMLIYSKRRRFIGDFLFGIAFLFFALVLLSAAGKELDLEHNPDAIHFFSSFDTHSHFNIVVFVLIGTLITCIVQSSAAVMAITILLCSTGVLPIYFGIALVLGENIGTTATANLAALGANTQARRAALAHLVFNVFGVVWVLCLFYPFVDAVCSLVGYDPTGAGTSQTQKAVLLPIVLAAFHTCFNVTNTFLLIWFIPQIERIVCLIIKPKAKQDEEDKALVMYMLVCSRTNDRMTDEELTDCSFANLKVGDIFYARGNYINALENYQEGLKLSETSASKTHLPLIYKNIGNVYCMFKDYGKGFDYYKKAYQIRPKNDNELTFRILANLFGVCINRKDLEGAKKYRKLYDINRSHVETGEKKAPRATNLLKEDQKQLLLDGIRRVMEETDEYCQPEFTVATLAKLIDSNERYVSMVVNDHFGKSFTEVLNDYRIKKACERLTTNNAKYAQLTIAAIGQSVGYKSQTTFVKQFRKCTGLTPSVYQKFVAEDRRNKETGS